MNETSHVLTQSIVPTLHMIALPCLFAKRLMSGFRKDFLVAIPEITVILRPAIIFGELVVKVLTGLGTSVTQGISNDLTSTMT